MRECPCSNPDCPTNLPGGMRCARCRRAFYCSRECQANHWEKGHREFCKEKREEDRVYKALNVLRAARGEDVREAAAPFNLASEDPDPAVDRALGTEEGALRAVREELFRNLQGNPLAPLCGCGHALGFCGPSRVTREVFVNAAMKVYQEDDTFFPLEEAERLDILKKHIHYMGLRWMRGPPRAIHGVLLPAPLADAYETMLLLEGDLPFGFCPTWHYLSLLMPLVMTPNQWATLVD